MTDPAVTAHHSNRAAFISQLDRRPRRFEADLPGPCYCGDPIQDHNRPNDACDICDGCQGYAEHTAYIEALDTLNTDDWLADDHGLRDNTDAAIDLARRTRP